MSALGVVMRLTKDKKVMLIGVPGTRNTWLWDCLGEELIDDIRLYEENFEVPHRGLIYIGNKKRTCWPPHTSNLTVSKTCKLHRSSYEKIATVRNPWERYISNFEFIRNSPTHLMHEKVMSWDFENFLLNVFHGNCTFDLAPQINFLFSNEGKLDFDALFRFEQTVEIKNFFVQRGYKFRDIPLNASPKNFASYYTPRTIKLVSQMCWFETAFFGYSAPDLEKCEAA